MSRSNLSGVLFALGAFALFASHDVAVKFLGGIYSPFQIIFFSVLLSFPLVTLMLMRDTTKGTLIPVHPWWSALRTASTLLTAGCVFYAFSTIPLAQVYAIVFAAPLLITMLSIPILGERVGVHRWGAVAVGLAGVLVVLRPGSADLEPGHFAALAAAVTSSLASIIVRKIGNEERPAVLLLYPMMTNFIVMAAILPWVYQPMPVEHLGLVAVMAVLGFLGGLMMIEGYRRADAAIVAPMQYSQMLWAILFGATLFSELPDQRTMTGAGIVIVSGLYVVFREARAGRSRNTPVLRTRSRAETGTQPRVSVLGRVLGWRRHPQ